MLMSPHSNQKDVTKDYVTLVRGIKTFLGIGNPAEVAYSWAAKSFVCVKRVPSTKTANQKGWWKSFSCWKPDCSGRPKEEINATNKSRRLQYELIKVR